MRLVRVKIENFLSIKRVEFKTSEFNIAFKQNNCGKMDFFEAINFFYNGNNTGKPMTELQYQNKATNQILVELEFLGVQKNIDYISNQLHKQKLLAAISDNDTIVISRNSAEVEIVKFLIGRGEVTLETGSDETLHSILPVFDYETTKKYYHTMVKRGMTSTFGILNSGILSGIIRQGYSK